MSEKILIIEDEPAIQEILKNYLVDAGYVVDIADNGLEGFQKFQQRKYDLILLDVMMPKIDGYVVLEMIRKESSIPVIMITAMGQEKHQIKGFDLKADDYIVKPFTISLVLKRIEAVLRRSFMIEKTAGNVLKYKEVSMDLDGCEVFVSGNLVSLTHKEYELLKLFLENQNYVFSREMLLEKIWGYDFYGNSRVVNVHIKNLRKKIGVDYIETVRGVGYKLGKKMEE